MNEPNEPFDSPAQIEEPADHPDTDATAFPWPPRPGAGVFNAFVDTWVESVFRPSRFFAAMPHRGFRSALAYYLPIAVIASAIMLFWRGVAVALGYADLVETFDGQPFDPERALIDFLLSPLTSTLYLLVAAGTAHIGLKMVGGARAPYAATVRLSAFATGPQLFVAVPLFGIPLSLIWALVLTVVGIREVHETSTGRAIAALVLPILLLSVLAMFVFLAGLFSSLAIQPR